MYDAYIIDDRQADRKHLRNLLVQYQIQNGVEARITGCTFADPLTPQDCFAYLRESGYAREALQPSTRQADGSIQNETEKTLWRQWEEGT